GRRAFHRRRGRTLDDRLGAHPETALARPADADPRRAKAAPQASRALRRRSPGRPARRRPPRGGVGREGAGPARHRLHHARSCPSRRGGGPGGARARLTAGRRSAGDLAPRHDPTGRGRVSRGAPRRGWSRPATVAMAPRPAAQATKTPATGATSSTSHATPGVTIPETSRKLE